VVGNNGPFPRQYTRKGNQSGPNKDGRGKWENRSDRKGKNVVPPHTGVLQKGLMQVQELGTLIQHGEKNDGVR